MRSRVWIILVAVLVLTCGCAMDAAMQGVLLPAMEKAWDGIKADIQRAIEFLPEDQQPIATADLAEFDRAFRGGDLQGVIDSSWGALADLCAAGIARRVRLGEIGPGVAESKLERIRMFYLALLELAKGGDA